MSYSTFLLYDFQKSSRYDLVNEMPFVSRCSGCLKISMMSYYQQVQELDSVLWNENHSRRQETFDNNLLNADLCQSIRELTV